MVCVSQMGPVMAEPVVAGKGFEVPKSCNWSTGRRRTATRTVVDVSQPPVEVVTSPVQLQDVAVAACGESVMLGALQDLEASGVKTFAEVSQSAAGLIQKTHAAATMMHITYGVAISSCKHSACRPERLCGGTRAG